VPLLAGSSTDRPSAAVRFEFYRARIVGAEQLAVTRCCHRSLAAL